MHNDQGSPGEKLGESASEDPSYYKQAPPRQHQYLLPDEQPLSILVVTWNLMGTVPSNSNLEKLLSPERLKHDLIVIGTQQCERSLFMSFFCEAKEAWENLLQSLLEGEYSKVGSHTMQGLHVISFIRNHMKKYLSEVEECQLKRGCFGYLPNKGAVGIGFNLGAKRLLFVNVHLDSSTKTCERRNKDLLAIVDSVVEQEVYEEAFIFGDLNYRLMLTKEQARSVGTHRKYLSMVRHDELRRQQKLAQFLRDYSEGILNFPPTYKVSPKENKYNESRIPGWTDRIFFKSQNEQLELLKYASETNALGSDHRPVYASFLSKFNRVQSGYARLRSPEQKCTLI